MGRFLVLIMLAVVAPANATPPWMSAQAPAKGQMCTSSAMIGTWELTTKPTTPGVARALKHITPTHFFVVRLDDEDVMQSGHGGPYAIANGTYTETIAHGFGGRFKQLRGVSISSSLCQIVDDVLHVTGEYQGVRLDERWRRMPGNH
jgi:hypothetical protein